MVDILSRGLKSGTIALDRAREIARFYTGTVDKAQTHEELQQNLQTISEQIPEMADIVLVEKMNQKQHDEEQLKSQVEELIRQGKLEEAAQLARQVL